MMIYLINKGEFHSAINSTTFVFCFLRNALHWFSTTSLSPDSNVEMTKVNEALSYFSKIDIVSNQGMKILRTFYTVKRKKTNNVLSQHNFFKKYMKWVWKLFKVIYIVKSYNTTKQRCFLVQKISLLLVCNENCCNQQELSFCIIKYRRLAYST